MRRLLAPTARVASALGIAATWIVMRPVGAPAALVVSRFTITPVQPLAFSVMNARAPILSPDGRWIGLSIVWTKVSRPGR